MDPGGAEKDKAPNPGNCRGTRERQRRSTIDHLIAVCQFGIGTIHNVRDAGQMHDRID